MKIVPLFVILLGVITVVTPTDISIRDVLYEMIYILNEVKRYEAMDIFDGDKSLERNSLSKVLTELYGLYHGYIAEPPNATEIVHFPESRYHVISNLTMEEAFGSIPTDAVEIDPPSDLDDFCPGMTVQNDGSNLYYVFCTTYMLTVNRGFSRSKRSVEDSFVKIELQPDGNNSAIINTTFLASNASIIDIHSIEMLHDIVTRKDCIKMEKSCPIPRKSIVELKKCSYMSCKTLLCLEAMFRNSSAICKNLVQLIYLTTVDKTYLQPTSIHMFDNNPPKKPLGIYKFPNPVIPVHVVREAVYMDCNGTLSTTDMPQSCFSIMHGDVNAVYKTFGSLKDTGTHNVIVTKDSVFNCEYSDPVWKDVSLLPAMSGHSDTSVFTIGTADSPGFKKGVDCFVQVCDLCIKQVPFILSGLCDVSSHIREGNHFIRMCNKDTNPIGYSIRPVHSSPRITDDYDIPSRFFLIDLYNYFHQIIVGSNPHLVGDGMQDSLIKGRISPKSCTDQIIANSESKWIYYYLKCGSTLHHHNEYLNTERRCNLKYGDYKFPTILQWVCRYWGYIRNIIIAMLLIITTYIFNAIFISYYLLGLICVLISPFTYLIHKHYPRSLRCKCCDGPWMPWHTCPDLCMCGHVFSEKHKQHCEFYNDNNLSNDIESQNYHNLEDELPTPGDPGYIEYVSKGMDEYKKKYKSRRQRSSKNASSTSPHSKISKKAYFSFRNPYSRNMSTFIFVLIIYISLCFMITPTLACDKCTENCFYQNDQFTVECEGRSHSCVCQIKVMCVQNSLLVTAVSSGSGSVETEILFNIPGCLPNHIDDDAKASAIISSIIQNHHCYNTRRGQASFQHYTSVIATGLPVMSKINLFRNKTVDDCADFIKDLEASSGYKTRVDQIMFSPTIKRVGVDVTGSLNIKSLSLVKVGEKEFIQSLNTSAFSDVSQNMIIPIKDAVKEQVDEENMRKRGELLQEFLHIINLLKYNGSIFGRDHSINYPDPPPTIEHVYAKVESDQHTTLDITMPAVSGRSASYRPIVDGVEIPVTFTVSIPEVAGVYDLLYSYTTCRTGSIDVIRFDKCVGSCPDCFDILKNNVRQTNKEHWKDHQKYEKISFDNPNTWGCEGRGCFTIGTGCLCAYCTNIPDPTDCYDVYNIRYRYSKALYCLSINEEHQCEHIRLGQTINRSGKVQIELMGSDEWASSVKSEHVAIHRTNGDIRMGMISALGEATGNFGNPQYNYNLSVIFKEQDIESHYVCKSGEDQDVVVSSCFKDTWSMIQTLERAPAYFMDSAQKRIYHVGSTVGTIRTVLEVPKGKLMWVTEPLKVQISSVQCVGCFRCLSGALCTAKVESSHTGFVYVGFSPGVPRMPTLNLLRGLHTYNMTVDFDDRSSYPTLYIMDGDRKVISEKKVTTLLKNGNDPRTTVRNATSISRGIMGNSPNSYSGFWNFISAFNPISLISGMLSSALVHWVFSCILYITLFALSIYFLYYIATRAFKIAFNKLIKSQAKKSI